MNIVIIIKAVIFALLMGTAKMENSNAIKVTSKKENNALKMKRL